MSISAIIIINPNWFDAMSKLPYCLKSVGWCDQRLICTSEITTELKLISHESNSDLVLQNGNTFSQWRNNAIKNIETDWVLFIDADETVTPDLKKEINTVIKESNYAGYAIPRHNFILGKLLKHGGWYPDYVLRLIKVDQFQGYEGDLHEQPRLFGPTAHLKFPLNHFKHDDLESMVTKTNKWSQTEGNLLFFSKHPPMTSWRFIRPYVTEVFVRSFKQKGILDGHIGLIDGIYQGYSRLISYIKLWELQQRDK